jgi:hypothetical protein
MSKAVADSMIVLHRDRGDKRTGMYVTGRDIDEGEFEMEFANGLWTMTSDTCMPRQKSPERDLIVKCLTEAAPTPLSPKTVAEGTGLSHASVKVLMVKLYEQGEIERISFRSYTVNSVVSVNSSKKDEEKEQEEFDLALRSAHQE